MSINISKFIKECKKLRVALEEEGADEDILAECDNIITDASEPLMIMVMGEFSTGKSSFINALLGKEVAVVNATPTTAVITKLRYGRQEKLFVHYKDGRVEEKDTADFARLSAQGDKKANEFHRTLSFVERVLPLKILKDMTIIDSPGLNSLVESHTQATKAFTGKADVVFWMFSAEDPVSQTECDAMHRLGARLKPVALVNKMDTIDEEEDDPDELLEQVRIKLEDGVQSVIGISAKMALDALAKNPKADLSESGLPDVEKYIEDEILPYREDYKMNTLTDDLTQLLISVLEDLHEKEKILDGLKEEDYAAFMDFEEHLTFVRDQLGSTVVDFYQQAQAKPIKNGIDLIFLSIFYQYGFLVDRDEKTQLKLLEQASLKKDADAQAMLGFQLIIAKESEKAAYWLMKSQAQQNPLGIYGLGYCYEHGIGVPQDQEKAKALYLDAASAGQVEAIDTLSAKSFKENKKRNAQKWAKQAAELGSAAGMYKMFYLLSGMKTKKKEADTYLRRSASKGYPLAMYVLAAAEISTDSEDAVKMLRGAAIKGNADAQAMLGDLYANGKAKAGIEKDLKKLRLPTHKTMENQNFL